MRINSVRIIRIAPVRLNSYIRSKVSVRGRLDSSVTGHACQRSVLQEVIDRPARIGKHFGGQKTSSFSGSNLRLESNDSQLSISHLNSIRRLRPCSHEYFIDHSLPHSTWRRMSAGFDARQHFARRSQGQRWPLNASRMDWLCLRSASRRNSRSLRPTRNNRGCPQSQ